MKRLVNKIRKKDEDQGVQKPASRITNDTVAEHREQILAEGKRFKYPMQYARHKLVINAVLITLATLILFATVVWWQLYRSHNSNTFFYRIAQTALLPAGSIDGEMIYLKDYLLNYRISEYYLGKYEQVKIDSEDGQLQLEYKKRSALDIAIANAYARKVIRDKNIIIKDTDVEESIAVLRSTANGTVSKEASETSSKQILGIDSSDLRSLIHDSIMRSRAAFSVDSDAKQLAEAVGLEVSGKKDIDLKKVAEKYANENEDRIGYGVTGFINIASNFGGMKVSDVAQNEVGVVSNVIKSSTDDGYYYVQVLEKKDGKVNFAYVQIKLATFDEQIRQLRSADKIKEYIYINVEEAQNNANEQSKKEE